MLCDVKEGSKEGPPEEVVCSLYKPPPLTILVCLHAAAVIWITLNTYRNLQASRMVSTGEGCVTM